MKTNKQTIKENKNYVYKLLIEQDNKILPLINMLKVMKLKEFATDNRLYGRNGLVELLKPIQERYCKIKQYSIHFIEDIDYYSGTPDKMPTIDYNVYINELEFLQKEINDVYQKFIFVLQNLYDSKYNSKND